MMLYVVVTTFDHTNDHWHTITARYIEVWKSIFWWVNFCDLKYQSQTKAKAVTDHQIHFVVSNVLYNSWS